MIERGSKGNVMKIHPRELEKPVYFAKGRFVTLGEVSAEPGLRFSLADLNALDKKTLRDLVIERYKKEPTDRKLNILPYGSFPVSQLVEEIQADTDVGQLMIRNEVEWIGYLVEKLQQGKLR